MIVSRGKLITAAILLLLAVAAFALKAIWFPTVDEAFFQLDYQRLEKAPAHVLILRPTRFADSRRCGTLTMHFNVGKGGSIPRLVGRNVTLAEIIQAAYECSASRVVLPADAPTNHYDFLVTVTHEPVERFRDAVKKQLGYAAHWQPNYADVLSVKVQAPNSPGLKPSSAGETWDQNFYQGKLICRHVPIEQLIRMIEYRLKQPVFDKTGLTGAYDFAIAWEGPGRAAPSDEVFKESLAEMGLKLVKEHEAMPMMVVEKAFH